MASKSHEPRSYKGVMISSTFSDIPEHRAALIRLIQKHQMFPVAMENDPGRPDVDLIDSSLDMVRQAAGYIGVLTHRYGQIPECPNRNPENLSITELEYHEAQRLSRPTLLFLMSDEHPVRRSDVEADPGKINKLAEFRSKAKKIPGTAVERIYTSFDSLEDFAEKAATSLSALKAKLDMPRLHTAAISTGIEGKVSTERSSLRVLEGGGSLVTDSAPTRPITQQIPEPDLFGRVDEVQAAVRALDDGRSVLIGGGPGFGKTALAVSIMYDPAVSNKFGARRMFVSFEGIVDTVEVLILIARALGLPPANDEGSLLLQLERESSRNSVVVVLDNLEDCLENDRGSLERMLRLLSQIEGFYYIATMRGVLPSISKAYTIEDLGALSRESARAAFLAVAGERFESDPALENLLDILEGHALSIRLVAAQAAGTSDLRNLADRWADALLAARDARGGSVDRLSSVEASLASSLKSKVVKSAALSRRLLSVIAQLPYGLTKEGAVAMLSRRSTVTRSRISEAIAALERLKLLERRMDGRLRMLAPLREVVRRRYPAESNDRRQISGYYLPIASRAQLAGSKKWPEVREQVLSEIRNLDTACDIAMDYDLAAKSTYDALFGIAELCRLGGWGTVNSVKRAAHEYRDAGLHARSAEMFLQLAEISLKTLNKDLVMNYTRLALEMAMLSGDKRLQANAFIDLAAVEADEVLGSAAAERHVLRALQLATGVSDHLKISGLLLLARLKTRDKDPTPAVAVLQEAEQIAARLNEPHALANVHSYLADVGGEDTEKYLKQAIKLQRETGLTTGLCNSLRRLGMILVNDGSPEEAIRCLDEAMEIAVRSGDLNNEAGCLVHLGRAHQQLGNRSLGDDCIQRGFAIWFKSVPASDPSNPGWREIEAALLAGSSRDAMSRTSEARRLWEEVNRHDLIRTWVEPLSRQFSGHEQA